MSIHKDGSFDAVPVTQTATSDSNDTIVVPPGGEAQPVAPGTGTQTNEQLQLDVVAGEEARALHRVVRALHDGSCPNCGHLADATDFRFHVFDSATGTPLTGYSCPRCRFGITDSVAREAIATFLPFARRAVGVFKAWHLRVYNKELPQDPRRQPSGSS